MERVNMVRQRKRKSKSVNTPAKLQYVESDNSDEEGERSGLPVPLPKAELAKVEKAFQVGNSKWNLPFDFTGIPGPIQAAMLALLGKQ